MVAGRRHLHLLRHAKSSWDHAGLTDHDRPLAPRGRRAGATMADHISALTDPPHLVVCSTATRTRQTLELIRPGLPGDVEIRFDEAVYGAWWNQLLEIVRTTPDDITSVMMIGHNPGMEDLAARLIATGDDELRHRLLAKFPTAALASMASDRAWRDLSPATAELTDYVVPRDLQP